MKNLIDEKYTSGEDFYNFTIDEDELDTEEKSKNKDSNKNNEKLNDNESNADS